jgi:hypothetical protein
MRKINKSIINGLGDKMKFRDMTIHDVKVIGPLEKAAFIKEVKILHIKYTVIDLQYSTVYDGFSESHCALALVQNKSKKK